MIDLDVIGLLGSNDLRLQFSELAVFLLKLSLQILYVRLALVRWH